MMKLEFNQFSIRSWDLSDVSSLARHANNPKIAAQLLDGFPHPYSEADAKSYISFCIDNHPLTHFTIDVDGAAVGAIGFKERTDRGPKSKELGYWLSEVHWNKGIMSTAIAGFLNYGFELLGLLEVLAMVYVGNASSKKVLERNGFQLIGTEEKAVTKSEQLIDVWYFQRKRAPEVQEPK